MKRADLAHALRAATRIIQSDRIVVIGSQSILGTWDEDELPADATMSVEVDLYPLGDDESETLAKKLDLIGEDSPFDRSFGYYVDGVGKNTAVLPDGWEDRLVNHQVDDGRGGVVTGLCLDPHDLCIAKLVAHREKDRSYVHALIDAGLIDPNILLERASATKGDIDHVYQWLMDAVSPRLAPADPPQRHQARKPRGTSNGGQFSGSAHSDAPGI